ASEADIIEKIDIGGPTLVRAAAKNHAHVGVVTSPDQYERIVAAVESGGLSAELRLDLARAAFAHTAAYDAAVAAWFGRDMAHPEQIAITLKAMGALRYGENPHQEAALYSDGTPSWWSVGDLLQGKEMSFNNFVDTEAAYRLVGALPTPAAVVVKHTNPAGAAVGISVSDAFAKAWAGDSLAAFGGVIAANVPVDRGTAEMIVENFVEIVIAPSVEADALEVFANKPNIRVMSAPLPAIAGREVRFIEGGALVQDRDLIDVGTWRQVAPGSADRRDLEVAWIVAGRTKSNAVVLVRQGQVVGAGAGDQSRIGAVQRALSIAGERSMGAVAASDAFFPFRDGLDALAQAGVEAVVEPGGSRNDDEVINAAVDHGLALFFTDRRHFLH
ncbi:MAG: bifunctional phosphoribosylaminoimidazolecarboxamide formyltransferase/IMP cyclohydrolase, partial [Acidimicrobiia bacterium]|nr:bifunctional phosphoribosylaminoimidazolecarboxamide formyltransferase/IMP cyclohydrolase [Acidimicrobiia bacterium]